MTVPMKAGFDMKLTVRTYRAGILDKIFPEKTKLKIRLPEIPFHALSIHFPTALYPVAIFFLFKKLIDGYQTGFIFLIIVKRF